MQEKTILFTKLIDESISPHPNLKKATLNTYQSKPKTRTFYSQE
jgi:hypothetical protein